MIVGLTAHRATGQRGTGYGPEMQDCLCDDSSSLNLFLPWPVAVARRLRGSAAV